MNVAYQINANPTADLWTEVVTAPAAGDVEGSDNSGIEGSDSSGVEGSN